MKDLALLLQIAEQADHGQFILDRSGRVVLWNPWMEAASGVERGEAQGLELEEIFGGVVSGRLRTAVTQALEHGSSALLSWAFNVHPLPLCRARKPDRPLPHSISITALSDHGEGRYCLVEVRDLTHVVHRERILREQKQIGNALKFSGDEAPLIHLTAATTGGGHVLGVKDQGIGIDHEHHAKIFKPFRRAAGSERVEGTGIGLAICQKAVSLHNGRLWVESRRGQGCHFKFTLGERIRTRVPSPVPSRSFEPTTHE